MAIPLQHRRGTTAEHSTFTGALGEVTVDTNKDVVVVHDGATIGGFPMAKQTSVDGKVAKITSVDHQVVRFNGTTGEIQGSGVVVDDSGNVGIGTSSPSTLLSIYKNSNDYRQISLENPFAGWTCKGYIQHWADGLLLANNHFYTGTHQYADNTKGSAEIHLTTGYIALSTSSANTVPIERMRIDASGNIGLGVTPNTWSQGKALEVGALGNSVFGNGSNDMIITANAYYNGGFKYAVGGLATFYEQNVGSHKWYTAPSGTAGNAITWTTAMTLDASGNLTVNTGALGYGTGSGGTVTQITSRTTGVTLNKPNGAITLVSAAGSTTWQTFTVTNSYVTATDTVYVCQKSGTDLYEIHVTNVSAGSFKISFKTTSGTTTEQPVFNFAVIKGVVA